MSTMKLKSKLLKVRSFEYIIFDNNWWDKVEEIAVKLLDTFRGNPDEDWWSRIITEDK